VASAPRVVLLACLPLLLSCAPYLWESRVSSRNFVSQVPCAQGPFELHATTLPAPWGQGLVVRVSGSATVHVEIWIDGVKVEGKRIVGPDAGTACQLEASQRGAAPPAEGAVVPSAGAPSPGGGSPAPAETSAPVLTEVTVTPSVAVSNAHDAVSDDVALAVSKAQTLVWEDVTVTTWEDIAHLYPAGRDVKILVWADSLQDFRAANVWLSQYVQRASVTDSEYLAYLRQDYDKRQAEARKKEAANTQFHRDCAARVVRNDVNSSCRDKGYRNASERAACEALAAKNAVTRECREDGYLNASVMAEVERCASLRVFDNDCCTKGYFCWRPYPPASPASADDASPKPSPPPGPPPLPEAEVQPPQPSVHAEWIPGSWMWDGFRWQWLSGGWRVPDSDIAAKATATAPALPPAAPAEPRPPQPRSAVEWVPGYWHWIGRRWVWVAGRWAVPPSAGLTWHSSVWIVEGGTVRLDPGRWVPR
jgi:hypothetical protein